MHVFCLSVSTLLGQIRVRTLTQPRGLITRRLHTYNARDTHTATLLFRNKFQTDQNGRLENNISRVEAYMCYLATYCVRPKLGKISDFFKIFLEGYQKVQEKHSFSLYSRCQRTYERQKKVQNKVKETLPLTNLSHPSLCVRIGTCSMQHICW